MIRLPVVRADCAEVPRPCPVSSCRHNLGPGNSLGSCVLDVTEAHPDGVGLRLMAAAFGVSHEAIRQIVLNAYAKLLRRVSALLDGPAPKHRPRRKHRARP